MTGVWLRAAAGLLIVLAVATFAVLCFASAAYGAQLPDKETTFGVLLGIAGGIVGGIVFAFATVALGVLAIAWVNESWSDAQIESRYARRQRR